MREPVRDVWIDRDLMRSEIPSEDLAFLELLAGPAILRLGGRDPTSVRAVTTLLHGNEPSGLRAIHRFLRSSQVPATNVFFYVGSVATALHAPAFSHRALPGRRDANRVWSPPWDTDEGQVARTVLDSIRDANPESLVDLHNNTGHNPAYGVAFRIGLPERSLVSLFADRVVHTPLTLRTLVEATVDMCPSVTIECGRAGDPRADQVAYQGLCQYLAADRIDFEEPRRPVVVFGGPVRVCLEDTIDLAFADTPVTAVPVTISKDIDRHNFECLTAGSPIGWLEPGTGWPLRAIADSGEECSHALFEEKDGELRTRRDFIPIMMTTNREVAKSDCLFYAVQRTEMPEADSQAEAWWK